MTRTRLVTVGGIIWRVTIDPGDREVPPDVGVEFVEIEDEDEVASCMIEHIWEEAVKEAELD